MYADVIFKKIFNVVRKNHLNKNKSKQAGSALLWEAKEKHHQEHVIASAILRGGGGGGGVSIQFTLDSRASKYMTPFLNLGKHQSLFQQEGTAHSLMNFF